MRKNSTLTRDRLFPGRLPVLDRFLTGASSIQPLFLLIFICCAVTAVGAFVVRDLRKADTEAETIFTSSIQGLQNIGDLQYDAQETRRATLYALTTKNSNLQVIYADQSRGADQRVKDGITRYRQQVTRTAEALLADRLRHDWNAYLAIRDEVLASILEGSTDEAVNLDIQGGVPAFERVRQDLQEVKHLYEEDASLRIANLMVVSRASSLKLICILCFTFLLSLAAVSAIQRSQMLGAMRLANLQMEFVASVSHELRTPLAVLNSAADNIADGLVKGDAALQKYGAILQNQSRRMSTMVDEILLFASTEDRKNRYSVQRVPVSAIMETVMSNAQTLIRDAGVTLEQHIEPSVPDVLGDLVGISQCLHNLIGNAIKYGGEARWIALNIYTATAKDGVTEEVRISVTDRGIGIDRSELAHIFDPFYRSPRVNAAQIHGTGLGLSLAKKIAEAMGGRLSVISDLGVGSTFTLHLRAAGNEDGQQPTLVSGPAATSQS
jgi:signal transduction histidine kinase